MITAYKDRYLHIYERAGKKLNIIEKNEREGNIPEAEEKKRKTRKRIDIYELLTISKGTDEEGKTKMQWNQP